MTYYGQNILFLDDNDERIRQVLSKWPAALVVKTVSDCIAALKSKNFTTVMLDFDLTGDEKSSNYKDPESGGEVVRWIIENKPTITELLLHSHNVPMASRMSLELKDAGYQSFMVPFGRGKLWGA